MKQAMFAALFALCVLLPVSSGYAESMETIAKSAILVDADTGTVLLDKKANDRMPTSSMSKTMTMYLVFDALKQGRISLEDKMTVSEKAWRMQGSKMFIKVGDSVRVEDLIRGVIIQSGNDAAVTLAEGLGGTEESFADSMNMRAKQIGLTNSHFMNATGWPDPDHYSTPRDLAVLAYRIIADFPEYYHYFSEKEFTYNKIRQQNRDPLLGRLPGADGMKTGHTEIGGFGLIGTVQRDGRRLILVENGLDSEKARADEAARLLEWGFRNFENRKLVSKDDVIDNADVWLGAEPQVSLVASADMKVVLPRDRKDDVKMTVSYMGPVKAPVKKGDMIGKLKVEIPGQAPALLDLLAGADVERKGIFGRAKDRAAYLLLGSQ